jgi:hypothetical protein
MRAEGVIGDLKVEDSLRHKADFHWNRMKIAGKSKADLGFSLTGRSSRVPETRNQSSSDENQFSRMVVGSAA